MQCDLCDFRGNDTIRVNGWIVCNKCSHNGILRQALEAKAQLEKLKSQISEAEMDTSRATALKQQAQGRIDAALRELEVAINALIPSVAQETRAGDAAAKARTLLAAFYESEAARRFPRTSY
jgi:saccharopine dehydrogenase-like NADP-dependent oxidoreductase